MKIRGKDDVNDICTAKELASQEELKSQKAAQKNAKDIAEKLKAQEHSLTLLREDSVSIGVSRTISQEFDPEAIAAERRKKVEDLKLLVSQGKYNPSSDLIARSVGEELVMEILSTGGLQAVIGDE